MITSYQSLRNIMAIDEACEAFEAAWQLRFAGPTGIRKFVTEQVAINPNDVSLLVNLAIIDLEKSWMHWHRQIAELARTRTASEILEEFRKLPTLENYLSLVATPTIAADWIDLAESELAARKRWGDGIGNPYFKDRFGNGLDHQANEPLRSLRLEFEDHREHRETIARFPLRGLCQVGRQRSTDASAYLCEVTPSGNRILIAAMTEATVSRHQLEIQCIHPNFAIITHLGKANSASFQGKAMPVGEPVLAEYPFRIHLPGRTLHGE